MKVTGVSFIKNAIQFDFPIKEALLSIEPLCDEIIVAVGDCTDGTRELVQSVHPTKIKIIDTVWDKTLNKDGVVLANETNKVLAEAFKTNAHWLIYIQGDEVLHEDGYTKLNKAMQDYANDARVDGLLLKYRHFYGSYDYVATSSRWYKNEIRIIKNNPSIYSYKDAQGFRKGNNQKLNVKAVDAYMHHYGWVKEPKVMMDKLFNAGSIWQGSNVEEERVKHSHLINFDYSQIDILEKYTGKHPTTIVEKINGKNWYFEHDLSYNKISAKEKFKKFIKNIVGKELFEYKNYKII
jgi:hypothetical protein